MEKYRTGFGDTGYYYFYLLAMIKKKKSLTAVLLEWASLAGIV